MKVIRITTAILVVGLALDADAQQATDRIDPETSVPIENSVWPQFAHAALAAKRAGLPVKSGKWMVVAANPLAAEAGAKILRVGGSAADAMVAIQAVLGLVEPQSSGLGGGAFLVWYDARTRSVITLDGRETAPLAATPTLFQDALGRPLRFFDAVVGGRSVGVPGTPMLLEAAHKRWGRLNWPDLFADGIKLAKMGFIVSPRLAGLIALDKPRLALHAETASYFLPGGKPAAAGHRLFNPAYGETLEAIANEGAKAIYAGSIANDIVAIVRSAPNNPGQLAPIDMQAYQVKERLAVCQAYRAYTVCGMGPPSSGGIAVGQVLGMLGRFDLEGMGPSSSESWRLIGDATRLAFADRGRYVADSDFVPVPINGLLSRDYLATRSRLLERRTALPEVKPGSPKFDHTWNFGVGGSLELPSTTHISIMDAYGNALSMTSTIENLFGSRLMVRGFLLNNELTDFSFRSQQQGLPVVNRVEPGKRPRSSMAPTIVLQDGKPILVIGSPGGSRIIGYVIQSIVAVLDWGLDIQSAVSMAHRVNRFGTYELEKGTDRDFQVSLEALGYKTSLADLNSGLHAIQVTQFGLEGGADPRREGIALGH